MGYAIRQWSDLSSFLWIGIRQRFCNFCIQFCYQFVNQLTRPFFTLNIAVKSSQVFAHIGQRSVVCHRIAVCWNIRCVPAVDLWSQYYIEGMSIKGNIGTEHNHKCLYWEKQKYQGNIPRNAKGLICILGNVNCISFQTNCKNTINYVNHYKQFKDPAYENNSMMTCEMCWRGQNPLS